MASKVVSMEEYKREKGIGPAKVNSDAMPVHPFLVTRAEASELGRVLGDPTYDQFFFADDPIPEDYFPPPRA